MSKKESAVMVYVPDDIRRKLDAEKKSSGMSFRAIIEKALRAWFAEKKEAA